MNSPDTPEAQAVRVDQINRHVSQKAGLDQELESQVPPRYGSFTVITLGVILAILFASVIWMVI
ncbi:hypothetical protein J2045_000264 [Peteryoungia aggregata LMG 23059]|uniref:Uncharacterized protein n=1 Tax=Peteryoungia aggregata LMG 23059 TaxID=1368425 RepID=A0ABU0G1P8_9HYPH|nr:hypothetical protein [Peteryoungia aggregata]MDQ0419254.1 hypothetical protein [Peteryoungia aggregata LMG 23059]